MLLGKAGGDAAEAQAAGAAGEEPLQLAAGDAGRVQERNVGRRREPDMAAVGQELGHLKACVRSAANVSMPILMGRSRGGAHGPW